MYMGQTPFRQAERDGKIAAWVRPRVCPDMDWAGIQFVFFKFTCKSFSVLYMIACLVNFAILPPLYLAGYGHVHAPQTGIYLPFIIQ